MIGIKELRESQKSEMFKLIVWVGSQSRLAKSLGVERQVVAGWVRRGRVSASAAIKIEQLTDGLFKKEALRPDVVCWEI